MSTPARLALHCSDCGQIDERSAFNGCTSCGGVLEAIYEPARDLDSAWLAGARHTIWGYADLLPTPAKTPRISLGEGDTPLLESRRHLERFGRRVFLKNETVNPTWSHKDRYHAVSTSMASDLGFTGVAGTSTGNHGVSAAAYAAAAGMSSILVYPPEMPTTFLHLTGTYGGHALVTEWGARTRLVAEILKRPGWWRIDSHNPFGLEGYKTIAYEIVRDLGAAPDMVLVPVGSGSLITGVWRGFDDLRRHGLIEQMPAHVACQAAGVDVLSQPLREGMDLVPMRDAVYSVALSTREPTADKRVLRALRSTNGHVVTVGEGQIMSAVKRLAQDGLAVEPASALPAAAIEIMCEDGSFDSHQTAVCVLTSSLAKSAELLPEVSSITPLRISIDGRELAELLPAIEALQKTIDA